ncbi:MAG TPA: thiamine phosphate synthase [bacterium]|nr:thiamine phosphate synthase [bacterium]
MLWMITDFSKTPGLEETVKHISICLQNGVQKVSLRNIGVFDSDSIKKIKEELDRSFPDREIYIHNIAAEEVNKYSHLHYPSNRTAEAFEIKNKYPDVKVVVSTHSRYEYEKAFKNGVDYALFSPVYPPISKPEDTRNTVTPVKFKNLYLLGGIDRMKALWLIERGFTNIAGISLFYGENAASVIKELSTLIMEKEYGIAYSD